MFPDKGRKTDRSGLLLSVLLIVAGLAASGISALQLASRGDVSLAQATQPSETTPSAPAGKSDGPADSAPGGVRPMTPAPEPARPDADAQKAGAKPALPPAPAEKMGEPIKK